MDQFRNHPLYRMHNIDSAINSLWEFYKKNFLFLFIPSLIMSLVIQYISSLVNFKDLQAVTDPMEILEKAKDLILPMVIISLITLLFSTIIHYYIIYNPGYRKKNIFVPAIRSLRYFVPYIIIMILLAFAGSFAIILGLFVLIIGVFFSLLYVMTLYLFILPTMMVEGADIGNTIRRIFKLAHHGFWSNIGWVSVFLILLIVISVILSSIILLPFSGSFFRVIFNPENAESLVDLSKNPIYVILSALVNAFTFPLMPIFACILYFNGKAKEEKLQSIILEKQEDGKVRVEDLYAKPYSEEHPDNPEIRDK